MIPALSVDNLESTAPRIYITHTLGRHCSVSANTLRVTVTSAGESTGAVHKLPGHPTLSFTVIHTFRYRLLGSSVALGHNNAEAVRFAPHSIKGVVIPGVVRGMK